MDFEWDLFVDSLPTLARGALTTAELAASSIGIGLVIGLAGGLARVSGIAALNAAAILYVTLLRGVPLLVTLLFFYYGLPSLGLLLEAKVVAILALALTNGAYVTEIVRAGINAIDRGQMRAARSLGMGWGLAMRRIVLPQALRRVLPPIGNEAITLLKNTALVSVIAIPDLLRAGTDIMTWQANTFSPFAGVALMYLAMTLPLVWLVARLESRWRVA
ncbi:amino acid ABC transporter permease [Falsiroseomonas selenitidurans]|uniref:Amino acid ABC transporter permease n=1 Tax=Falsiroseomonas selenitidurans TaxID=2716335 RepID=A0ABX1E037_9PROT|nr:amino acid ABC transporter permease [Falsiroseomonas selenitidurans]NKC30514.1 amino acid ABC transporter permease [Falsiroseomonas selenitidurans]